MGQNNKTTINTSANNVVEEAFKNEVIQVNDKKIDMDFGDRKYIDINTTRN